MLRIIIKNMDKKNYVTYGFSMALFSLIIYIIASLIQINDIINLGADSENVRIVFSFYYILVVCVGVFFIFYALNFYIKSRMKDYATFIILGVSKVSALLFLILEFFLIYIMGVMLGIILGVITIEVICSFFCMNGVAVSLHFMEIIINMKFSIVLSLVVFFFGCVLGLIAFLRSDLSKTMTLGVRKENRYYWMCVLSVLGIVLLYVSIRQLEYPSFGMILLSMLENFAGIYIVLTFGLSILDFFVRRYFIAFYEKYLLGIAGFLYRYKSNRMIVFITYILNVIILFFAGGMIITSYLDVERSESITVILLSSYFVAAFTIICNIGILFIKQVYESSEKMGWTEKLRYLGMGYKDRQNITISEFKILIMIPMILSNLFVWIYILAECRRVGANDIGHIGSFAVFQMVLILIQGLYYSMIKKYLLKGVKNR